MAASATANCLDFFKRHPVGQLVGLLGFAVASTLVAQHVATGATTFDIHAALMHNLWLHCLLGVVAIAFIAHDANVLGPTMAIRHGAVAAIVSWILVVPFWTLTEGLLDSMAFLIIGIFCVVCTLVLILFLNCIGCIIAVVLVPALVWVELTYGSLLLHSLGPVLVFLLTFMIVRQLMGLQKIENWYRTTMVDAKTDEFRTTCDFFKASCMPWEHKYNFDLEILNLYRIRDESGPMESEVDASKAARANIRKLFHGTSRDGAQGIISDGFRLPSHAGMFGKGVYFADCPLKSWQYCFSSRQLGQLIFNSTGRGGLILMCRVDLGAVREQKEADAGLTGHSLNPWYRRLWKRLRRQEVGGYDSVVGITVEDGGALRVPEYVTYRPEKQIRLEYMFEVRAVYR
jgi:hypothetical protein